MTRVEMDWEDGSLLMTVEGHTHAESAGGNLVCAAVSMMTQAAMQTLRDLKENGWLLRYEETEADGYANIRAVPKASVADYLKLVMLPVITGFELLSSTYPDKVAIGWGRKKGDYDTLL